MTRPTAYGLVLGACLDALLGDPRRGHPVAGFGSAAGWLERRAWRDSRVLGAGYALGCVAGPVALAVAAERGAGRSRPAVAAVTRVALTAAATWAVLGGTTLGREAGALADALAAGDLAAARRLIPALCGRDPAGLDEAELVRATVESVAENTSDAVVAPLVWGALLGVPGLVGYRAVNTLDAMVGHRSARYARFGWAAARLDDAANLLPARLTGVLVCLLAPTVGGDRRAAWSALHRFGGQHPSPNAGRCEAAFAGALGVSLGGRNVYAGRVEQRPKLGTGPAPGVVDVERARRLSRLVGWAAVAVAAALAAVRR